MKLVKQFIEKDKSGYVTLIPEEFEDMWHVYNLIQKHDQLRAVTIRYVSVTLTPLLPLPPLRILAYSLCVAVGGGRGMLLMTTPPHRVMYYFLVCPLGTVAHPCASWPSFYIDTDIYR